MKFDINAARSSGYSDDEIAEYLATENKFDLSGALKSGYSASEVIGFLSGADAAPVEAVTDTGDESARLAARYKAPEKPGLIERAASAISSVLPKPVDPMGIASGKPLGSTPIRAEEPVKQSKAPTPYRDRREALDDAVNLLEEGADQGAVTEAFGKAGIKFDEIVAHGQKRGSEYFKQQTVPQVDTEVARLAARYPAPQTTDEIKPYETSVGEDIANFAKRVSGRSSQAFTGLLANTGVINEDQAAAALARDERRIQAARAPESIQAGFEEIGQAKTYGEAVTALARNPGATATMLAESVLMTAPVLAASAARLPAVGLAAATGGFSASLEYGGAMADVLSERRIDMLDANKLAAALKDPEIIAEIRDKGTKRGLTIGIIDGLTAGIAGKFLEPVQKTIAAGKLASDAARRATVGAWAKELGVQVAGGSGGEFAAQQLTGENKPADVLLEGLGEGVSAPFEARSNLAASRKLDPLQQIAQEIEGTNIDVAGGVDGRVRTLLNPNAYDSTLISPEQTTRQAGDVGPSAPVQTQDASAPANPQRTRLIELETVARGGTSYTYPTAGGESVTVEIPEGRSLSEQERTELGDLRMGRSQPISFTPADSPTARAGLAPIVVPVPSGAPITQEQKTELPPVNPEIEQQFGLDTLRMGTTNVGTTGGTGAAPAVGGVAGSDQRSGGVDLPGLDAAGTGQLSGGDAGLPATNAGADVPARGAGGQPTASLSAENNNAVGQPVEQWVGRKGGGYETEADAKQALPGRQRMFPALDWTVEQMPGGKFRLAGYEQQSSQPAPTVGTTEAGAGVTQPTQAAPITSETASSAQAAPAQGPAITSETAAPITAPSGKPFSTEKTAAVYAQQNGITGYSTVKMDGGWVIKPTETTLGTQAPQAIQATQEGQQAPAVGGAATTASSIRQPQAGVLRNAPTGGSIESQQIRDTYQAELDAVKEPIKLNAPTPEAEAQVEGFGNALGKVFGIDRPVVAFSDSTAPNGFAFKGQAFVNTADVEIGVQRTSLHEFTHLIEAIAEADTQSGKTGTAAQNFIKQIYSVFDDVSDDFKRVYVEKYLHAADLKDLKGDEREAAIQGYLKSQKLRSEITADFMGNRANDRAFLEDLAEKDPNGFESFVQKWISLIDNLMQKLRGAPAQERGPQAAVDRAVKDLAKAKMVARDALIAYRKGSMKERRQASSAGVTQGRVTQATAMAGNSQPMASNRAAPETPEFKKFFGNSKVVDAAGNPMVVYHGTNADVTAFDDTASGANSGNRGFLGRGFYFSSSPQSASMYAGVTRPQGTDTWRRTDGGNVMPVYLSLQNPLEISEKGLSKKAADALNSVPVTGLKFFEGDRGVDGDLALAVEQNPELSDAIRSALTALGYDGVIVDGGREIVAFRPEQIKSATGNDGQFDASNPDIRRSNRAATEANKTVDVNGVELPLNDDGTVTLYHHTDKASADQIRASGQLRSKGEPDVYLTTRQQADTGYGDTAVAVQVDPAKLTLDDEFPDGRTDFRMSVGKPGGSVSVVAEQGDNVMPPEQINADGIMFSLRKVEEINDAPEITMKDLVGQTVFPILADLTAAGYVYMGKELRGGPYYTLLPSNSKAGLIWANDGKGVASIKNKKAARGVIGLIVAMKQDSHATNNTVANIIFRAVEDEIQKGSVAKADIPKLDDIVRGLATRTATKTRKVDGKKVKETKQVFPKFADFPGFSDRAASEKFLRAMPFEARGLFFEEMTKPTVEDLGLGVIRKVINDTVEPDLRGLNMGDVVMAIRFDPNADTIELGEKTGTPEHDSYRYGVKGEVIGKFKRPISFENVFVELMKERRAAGKDRPAGNYRSLTLRKPEQLITEEIAGGVGQEKYKTFKTPAEAKAAVAVAAMDWKVIDRPAAAGVKEFLRTARIYGEGKVPSFGEAKMLIKDGRLRIFRLANTESWFSIESRGNKRVMTHAMVAQPGVERDMLFGDMVFQARANGATHIEEGGKVEPITEQKAMRRVAPIVSELSEMPDADIKNLGIDPKEVDRLNGLIGEGEEEFSAEALPVYSNRVTDTPAFKRWFGDSKVVDTEGKPLIMYHGTAQDISTFRAKQAKAIFVTSDPDFAEGFAGMSEAWMLKNYEQVLTQEQIEAAFDEAESAIRQELRSAVVADVEVAKLRGGKPTGIAQEKLSAALSEQMPSGPNIIPVYVSAQNPFDFENPDHIEMLKEYERDNRYTPRSISFSIGSIETGYWEEIERPTIQAALKDLGFDGFYVEEDGKKNLAVYKPEQLKSAIGNNGEFDPANPDIRMSNRATFREDIPREEWLAEKIEDAELGGKNEFGVPRRMGPATGYFSRPLNLPTYLLGTLRGERGEQENVRESSLEYIRSNWDEVKQEPAYVEVDPFGRAWVSEGNHRIMVARELGEKTFPTEVKYFSGGQRKAGPWAPDELLQLDERVDIRASNRVLEDRSGLSRLPYQGYVKAEVPRVQAARKMAGILAKLDAGQITQNEFELQVRELSERMALVSATKDANKIVSERARGADIVREKLIAARRRGEIESDTAEFALWALQQNPAMAEGLGISVREQPENQRGAAGDYNPAAAIMRVFKGASKATTAVHEILHHTERMMPEAVQTGIRKEWAKAYAKALNSAKPAQREALEKMLAAMAGDQKAQADVRDAFNDGTLDADVHYQLVNPSEFWAVNATDILQRRYEAGSWIGKAKQWLREMVQKAKGLVGMRSNAPVLRGLEAVLNSDGERQSKKMLSEGKVFEDISAPDTNAFKRWFGDSKVVDAEGRPLVVYHGTGSDITAFDAKNPRMRDGKLGKGIYLTPSTQKANFFANLRAKDGSPNVMPLYAAITNPFEIFGESNRPVSGVDQASLIAKGYDGVVLYGDDGAMQEIVAFRPEQIKSAIGNNGEFDPENPDIRKSNRVQPTDWRDEAGRVRFMPGAVAYRYAADIANKLLDKTPLIGSLKPIDKDLALAMRRMKTEIENAQTRTAGVASKLGELPEDERKMISDVIEGELKRGVKPAKRVLEVAASMQSIMSEQSAELVRLGMLTSDAASRWDGKYLPRFYEQTLKNEASQWAKAAKALLGRKKTMQGIKGSNLKGRGIFETIPVDELEAWLAEGWEERDPNFDPATDTEITVWRDYTRAERENMGEIRDAMFRFVMGYMKSQRDVALGRLYENLADTVASKSEKEGYVQVPKTNIENTKAPRYGKLSGKWVPQEVLDHLSAFDGSMENELLKVYRKGLSMWKEGKTVLNPVAHANNVLSNLTMAHFAGVSYWDANKYLGAARDIVKGAPMLTEAREAGLFGGTVSQAELVSMLPDQLKVLAAKTESNVGKIVDTAWNAMSFFLRKPLGVAYEAEDLYFRYLIYRDARAKGMDPEDAVTYAQQYIFTYDDLPKGARTIRDAPIGIPFFSWTYKAIPMIARTALEYPWRMAAPAAAMYAANAAMYAIAAGADAGDDEPWWEALKRYVMDAEFREQAKQLEQQERKNLPEWQKGFSSIGTPKAIRLGNDDLTNLPLFLDVSRIFPGGDLGDFHNNLGGVPLPAWLTPNNPVLTSLTAFLQNKDSFTGKEIVSAKLDTGGEKSAKWGEYAWRQFAPAVAPFNYHFDRTMNSVANATGSTIDLGVKEYTGVDKMGQPVQPKYAAMQTFGLKVRPTDLEVSEQIEESQRKQLIRELDKQIRQIKRLENKGYYSEEKAEAITDPIREKRQRLKEGLTIDGEERE